LHTQWLLESNSLKKNIMRINNLTLKFIILLFHFKYVLLTKTKIIIPHPSKTRTLFITFKVTSSTFVFPDSIVVLQT